MAPFLAVALIGVLSSLTTRAAWDEVFRRIVSPLGMTLGAGFLLWLSSALLSDHVWASVETVIRTVAMVFAGLLFSVFLDEDSDRRQIMGRALVWISLAVILFVVACFYLGDHIDGFVRAVGGGEWASAQVRFKMFGSAVVCLLPVVFYFGLRIGGSVKWAAFSCVPLVMLELYADGVEPSYSGILGMVGSSAFVAVVLLLGRIRPAMRRIVLSVLLVGALGGAVVFLEALPKPPAPPVPQMNVPFPDWHRQVIWGFTWEQLKSSPVLGVGPNTISKVPGAHDIIPGMNQEYIPAHPHNWVLEIGSETGILGLSAFVAALLMFVRRYSVRVVAGRCDGWAGLFLMGVFWSSAMVNFSIWAAWWVLVFVLLVALLPWNEKGRKPWPGEKG
ncbi:O-antigen ligase family protein [Rhodospirillaceae bacterium KN72]|uniref:O-antigen ligase family protein n=1 Tax=Pacificispira spongiicola TaxID=2729598 RepID=A0A7Y0DWS6_9PROT|nr:O-antigen ligase family protein [Pacificispira spongiicola]NMM43049.1 O-antigen ligase family protein [Pacificispira spongiicola]